MKTYDVKLEKALEIDFKVFKTIIPEALSKTKRAKVVKQLNEITGFSWNVDTRLTCDAGHTMFTTWPVQDRAQRRNLKNVIVQIKV